MSERRLGPKGWINLARTRVSAEIAGTARSGGLHGGALSGEGYSGGYRDALSDVLLLLNGVVPHRRHYYEPVAASETPAGDER